MATVKVQIRMKKKPKPKNTRATSTTPDELPPSYDEALMIPDPVEAAPIVPTAATIVPVVDSSGDGRSAHAPAPDTTESDELSITSLQSELLRCDSIVYRRKNSITEEEEGEEEGADPVESRGDDEQSYLDDEHAFESYEDEHEEQADQTRLPHDFDESRSPNESAQLVPRITNDQINFRAGRATNSGSVVIPESIRENVSKESVDHHRRAAPDLRLSNTTQQAAAAVSVYDENTYAIISRLRSVNKSLSTQLEKQTKLIGHLQEEKKQHLQLIQTLRADLQMHKQSIKGVQAHGRRLYTSDDALSNQSARPSSTGLTPTLPQVKDALSSPRGGASHQTKSIYSPRKGQFLQKAADIEANTVKLSSRPNPGQSKASSPRVPSNSLSPSSPFKRPQAFSPRSTGITSSSADSNNLGGNNQHAMQQLLEKYAAKLEKTEQEKKETQLYTHHGGGANGSSNTVGSNHHEIHPRGLLADDFWKDMAPPNFHGLSSRTGNTSGGGSALTMHIGLGFEQLLSHHMVAFHDHSLDASTRDWLRELRVRGAQMLQLHRSFQAMSCTFQRLAESSHLYQLAETLSRESRELLSAEQSLVFVVDTAEQEFWCRVPRAANAKDMITVRSKLMPFATAGHVHRASSPPSQPIGDPTPLPSAAAPILAAHLSAGGLPSGLASMVYHTKKPLLLPAGYIMKHPCYSTASDNTDRMISHPSASTLLLPILHRGHTVAVIQLCGKTTIVEALGLSIALEKCDAFTQEDQALLLLLCHFASGLFPKVSYFTEVESNKVNEETLIQLAPEIFTCLRFEELGKIVIQNAKEILDANRCSLFVADNVERTLHNWQSDISGGTVQVYDNTKKTGMTIPFGHGIVGLVAETSQVINIPDAYDDPRFNSSWDKKTNYRTKSMLAVPILTNTTKRQPIRRASHANGDRFGTNGVVQVINKSGGAPFRAKDEFLLKTITKLIALAIENSQLFQKNQELCANLGKLIANADLVEAVISLGISAEDIIGVESAAIYVYDHLAQEMVTFHRKRRHKIALKEQMYRSSLFGDAVRSKDLIIVNNISDAPHFNAYVDSIAGINARNVLFAPLVVDDPDAIGIGGGTKIVGLMHLVNTKGRKVSFERHDLFLSVVASMCCSVIASIMEKQVMLKQKDQTSLLLDTSMSFFKEMSPIGVINAVYNACTSIFNVEKAHLFLWETDKRHMWTSKLLPHAEANTVSGSSSFSSSSTGSSNAGSSNGLSEVLNPGSGSGSSNHIPSLGSQLRRISVLTGQKLKVPTTEGLLEQVLVKGTVLLVKHWVDGSEAEKEGGGSQQQRAFGAGTFRKYTLRITASDEKIGFIKHSVVACPVWDNYGLEIVGILVLLFPKGRAPPLTELTNLPILCRQISGALNVCSDLSAVSTRSKKLQGMLEMSMKKPTLAMSLTLSFRGHLVTFSQPVNLVTSGFNAATLSTSVHVSIALNVGVRILPMDEEGNRWGFQISAASVHEMNTEHYVKWIGKELGDSLSSLQLFDKLRTDLQSVYVRKETMTGEINRRAGSVHGADSGRIGGDVVGSAPAGPNETLKASNLHHSLSKNVILEIRKLLWEFVDNSWKVDVRRACQVFDAVDPSRRRCISRKHLEQVLSAGERSVRLDQTDWDLLHTLFADPHTDLVNVESMFESLAPHIHVVPHFAYEIVPIRDPITQTVVNVHIILTAAIYNEWKAKSNAQVHALLMEPVVQTKQLQRIYLTQATELLPTMPLSDYSVRGALQVFILLPSAEGRESTEPTGSSGNQNANHGGSTPQREPSNRPQQREQAHDLVRCMCCNKLVRPGFHDRYYLHPMPVPILFIYALHAAIERHFFRSSRVLEIKCGFWIASILAWTCSELLKGPTELLTLERIIDNTLAGFNHVIRMQDKVIGVIHARRGIQRGMTHALQSSTVLAENEGLEVVHAIVTDFVTWVFIRYEGDAIVHHWAHMESSGMARIPTIEALAGVVGLICSAAQE